MNEILRDHINKTCVVYLDDILIFSTSLQEHMHAVNEIFQILQDKNLKIQVDKCNFLKKETEFLGHILTKNGIKPNPNKIATIEKRTLPKTEKQIKSFLGITGYYRKFIKDYAKVAQPITKYLKKDVKINLKDPTYIEAFEKLKQLISSHPILRYPDFEKMFTLTTDASNYAIGAFLSQEGHPVCFASRTLNTHEKNYSATDKEFLAILWSVGYFRPYLYGRKFKILTDHQFLHTKYRGKDISPRHQRWLLKLGEYDFNIDYLQGKENRVADFLSRIEETNEEKTKERNEYNSSMSDINMIANIDDNMSNHITIVEQLEQYFTKMGKPAKIIADNEFNSIRIKELLDNTGIELHLTKPNSHTGNADVERLHNSIAEKCRIIYKTEKQNFSVKQIMQKCIRNYNERHHSVTKFTPTEIQNNKVDLAKVKENIDEAKRK